MDLVIIEVVVGLSFLFFLISIVSSAIQEAISGVLKLRARDLEKGVINLLTGKSRSLRQTMKVTSKASSPDAESPQKDDDSLLTSFFDHSLIAGYRKGDTIEAESRKAKLPAYMASRTFRNVLFDVTGLLELTNASATSTDAAGRSPADKVTEALENIPGEHLRNSLETIWKSVDKDVTQFREAVERWFDRAMERVSGWYKRRTQLILFIIGFCVAFAINADAIRTADTLWKDDGVRSGLVAELGTQEPNPDASKVIDRLHELSYPIGWGGDKNPSGGEIPLAVAGWLITGVAVTFGAAFWFDFLGKVAHLRATGIAPKSVLNEPATPEDERSAGGSGAGSS